MVGHERRRFHTLAGSPVNSTKLSTKCNKISLASCQTEKIQHSYIRLDRYLSETSVKDLLVDNINISISLIFRNKRELIPNYAYLQTLNLEY